MKKKYIDEVYRPLFIQGSIVTDGETLELTLSNEDAGKLVKYVNKIQSKLVKTAMAFSEVSPTVFTKHWYDIKEQTHENSILK